MSAAQNSLLPLPSSWEGGTSIQTPQPADDSGRIIFTRQLWQRTMPDEIQGDQSVSNRSHSQDTSNVHNIAAGPVRRSSTVSSRSLRNSSTASHGSKAPLTPEESPPTRASRKRNTGVVEQEDVDLDRVEAGSAHSRTNSDDNTHVCICQPDPKIPRPRNGKGVLWACDENLLTCSSIHLVSSTPSSQRHLSAPRLVESGDL